MKAAVMYGPNDIRYEDVPYPKLPKGGFILKVEAVGLCGSDIRNLTSDSRKGKYPHIYGHEVVGTIVEVDEGVDSLKVGDRYYVYPVAHCLKCEYCRSGHHEHCTNVNNYADEQGGFADYIAYPKERVERGAMFKIDDGIDPINATLAEPLSSTYACVENINVTLGDTVVILGAGPIGVFLSVLSKLRGAKKVILIDLLDARLKKASEFGLDYVINSSEEDAVEKVMEITGGRGADKVISANPSTESQVEALHMAKKGGIVVFFGGVPKGKLTEIDTNLIHYNGLWIYGHYGANSMQVQKSFELSIDPVFPAKKIITHVMPLSKINEAINLTKTGEAMKVVLLPNEEWAMKDVVNILIACGSGIATSTVAQEKVKEILDKNSIPYKINKGTVNQIPDLHDSVDLVLTTTKYRSEISTPILFVFSLISGINEKKIEEDIVTTCKKILKDG